MTYNDLIARLKLPFSHDRELIKALYHVLGFYPRELSHYKLALMHRSSGRRNDKGRPLNNERLEFLGDALLDAVVGHIVYEHFPGKREGFLTNTRSKLVSRETLGKLADEMGLSELVQSNGRSNSHNNYMGGNAFEALVGAIFLDQGYQGVERFVKRRILDQMLNIDKVAYKEVNFKSKLLEWTQKNRVRMEFEMQDLGKDKQGSPVFLCQVVIEGVEGGKGRGFSKKEAQQQASKETLSRLRREPQYVDAIFTAKSNRTKMEEEPVAVAPALPGGSGKNDRPVKAERLPRYDQTDEAPPSTSAPASKEDAPGPDEEFDLSDISATPDRDAIIAAAEEAAYGGKDI